MHGGSAYFLEIIRIFGLGACPESARWMMTLRNIIILYLLLPFAAVMSGVGACRAQDRQTGSYLYRTEYGRRYAARMEMGVSLAAAYMGVSAAEGFPLAPRLGVRGALVMSLCWAERYGLQLELGYVFNKIRAEGADGVGHDVRSNVMEIPLLFSLRGMGPLRLNVGPVLSLAGTGRYDAGTERVEFGRLRTTVGYSAGASVALSQHLAVDARFTGNMGRTLNYYEGLEGRNYGYWATLGLCYMF